MTVLRQRFFLLVLLPLLLLAVLTVWFRLTDADIMLIHQLRAATGIADWTGANSGIWGFLKVYGVVPAFLVVLLSLGGIFVGLLRPRFAHLARPGLYLVLVLLVGAGVITNLLLKDHWGRPRPRHVAEFGGSEPFEKVLTLNFGEGKSFPCGHATTGFFFFAVALLLRNRWPRAAALTMAGALVYGTVIGAARMLQGGHFASDTVWAASIMWFTSFGLLHALRLQDFRAEPLPFDGRASRRPWAGPTIAFASLALFVVALVSVPRTGQQKISLSPPGNGQVLDFDFKGSLRVVADDTPRLEVDFDGVGTPIGEPALKVLPSQGGLRVIEQSSGLFTEKNFRATLFLKPGEHRLRCSPLLTLLDPPPAATITRLDGGGVLLCFQPCQVPETP